MYSLLAEASIKFEQGMFWLGVCIEKRDSWSCREYISEREADTDGEDDETDSEEVEHAVIIVVVIHITGVQGTNLAGKVGSKHTGTVGSMQACWASAIMAC